MEREVVKFEDREDILEFWNNLYFKDSNTTHNEQKYTHITKIHKQHCDGKCVDWILQRESDGKFFKLEWWEWWEGGSDGYSFNNGDNSIVEVFPKQIITVEYV